MSTPTKTDAPLRCSVLLLDSDQPPREQLLLLHALHLPSSLHTRPRTRRRGPRTGTGTRPAAFPPPGTRPTCARSSASAGPPILGRSRPSQECAQALRTRPAGSGRAPGPEATAETRTRNPSPNRSWSRRTRSGSRSSPRSGRAPRTGRSARASARAPGRTTRRQTRCCCGGARLRTRRGCASPRTR
ncbi:hypothetical protein BV20DRAFT_615349 [Pilatotrama ljubarskyi]|nr:hypothetical protein BV20DRAFT_615349 [Pilatotrama ljubarskyi]